MTTKPASEAPSVTSAIAPNLDAVRSFVEEAIAKRSFTMLVAAIVGLIARMARLNYELNARLVSKQRKRPPSESFRRLQQELPFLAKEPDNDVVPPGASDTASSGAGAGDVASSDGTSGADASDEGASGSQPESKDPKKRRGPKNPDPHGRPKLPEHLLRVPAIHRVADDDRTCPTCEVATEFVTLKTTAEVLDIEPMKFIVREHQCEVVACPLCRAYVRVAERPDQVVDRGILGEELLIQTMVEHYGEAVPFERIARRAREQGAPLSPKTLAASTGKLIDLLDPIVKHIDAQWAKSDSKALDATSIRVLDVEHPLGIRTGTLWLLEGDHRYARFRFAPSGHDDHLERFFAGVPIASLMCDGSATHNCLDPSDSIRGGCHAHARRRLVAAVRVGDVRAVEGIEIYKKLFAVDALSKKLGESLDERLARRRRESTPIFEELRAWIAAKRPDVEPKSPLGDALRYMHRQWKRLARFLDDPRMELTNNEVERDLRGHVLNRKTWLFCGHEESARRTADALTILVTCRKLGIDARAYLRHIVARLLAGETNLEALLPETFAARVARDSVDGKRDVIDDGRSEQNAIAA